MNEAARQMMDHFLARVQHYYNRGVTFQASLDKMKAMHALVAAYPDIPPGTPDFHVSMQFQVEESDYGGSSWSLRGVQLRNGKLEITTGHGSTDGICASDQFESPTEDTALYLSALDTDPQRMSGPFV